MRVIQMLATMAYGDAVGNDALAIDKALKTAGYNTCIYAENIGKRIPAGTVQHISAVPKLTGEDIILYHLSVGTDLNRKIADYPGRKIIIYHNITPCEFFIGYNPTLWQVCKNGRDETIFLADKAEYCLADSNYNKSELQRYGYKCPIDVLPILIPFDDYRQTPNKDVMDRYSGDGFTNILFTGRIAPNKCQHDIIAAFYQYHKYYNEKSRLILVGNYVGTERYYEDLRMYAEQLGIEKEVVFPGHIGFDEILAYYHLADIFLCMSEHEGFCVPLVEAMYFSIPVIAYDSSAISDTLSGSGFLLKEKDPLMTAGVIDYILNNEKTRETIVQRGKERLKDFSHDIIEERLMTYLNGFISKKAGEQ